MLPGVRIQLGDLFTAGQYPQGTDDAETKPDPYILLVEKGEGAPDILGTFPHNIPGGGADIYTDEYLAAYPDHVIEFWDYVVDTVYYPLLQQ